MRGKVVWPPCIILTPRITPAYAGKSGEILSGRAAHGDHPRVCGEKQVTGFASDNAEGSPPRMRGKVKMERVSCLSSGITPAYAGKSCYPQQRELYQPGSPPRMRGKEYMFSKICVNTRITPAYAGKSETNMQSRPLPWDHPRVCGEKMNLIYLSSSCMGSPPRMRGKDGAKAYENLTIGITPAYAGKRMTKDFTEERLGDHPRVCGEKTKKIP